MRFVLLHLHNILCYACAHTFQFHFNIFLEPCNSKFSPNSIPEKINESLRNDNFSFGIWPLSFRLSNVEREQHQRHRIYSDQLDSNWDTYIQFYFVDVRA